MVTGLVIDRAYTALLEMTLAYHTSLLWKDALSSHASAIPNLVTTCHLLPKT